MLRRRHRLGFVLVPGHLFPQVHRLISKRAPPWLLAVSALAAGGAAGGAAVLRAVLRSAAARYLRLHSRISPPRARKCSSALCRPSTTARWQLKSDADCNAAFTWLQKASLEIDRGE